MTCEVLEEAIKTNRYSTTPTKEMADAKERKAALRRKRTDELRREKESAIDVDSGNPQPAKKKSKREQHKPARESMSYKVRGM